MRGDLFSLLAIHYFFEAWRLRTRRSLRERVTRLRHAVGMSVMLLCLITAMLVASVGMNIGVSFEISYLFGGLAALAMWFWASRFVSRPQTSPWRQLIQAAIRKITAFVVGGSLTALVLWPVEETLLTQIVSLIGGMIMAIGPLRASARNASHAAS